MKKTSTFAFCILLNALFNHVSVVQASPLGSRAGVSTQAHWMSRGAASGVQGSGQPTILSEITDLAHQCVVQPYTYNRMGKRQTLRLQSHCTEIQSSDPMHADLYLKGQHYRAVLAESADSDGGDLDHLSILNDQGQVMATRQNVAAFNEILIALAGGDTGFPELQVR